MKKLIIGFLTVMTVLCSTNQTEAQDYETAIGLRAAWGFAVTGKKFINDGKSIEVIANYRSFGSGIYDYSWLSFTGLYQIHKPLDQVLEGLYWYYGGGINFTTYSGDFDYPGSDFDSSFFGIAGNLGLDYKFDDYPINLSVDWIPVLGFGSYGFGGEGGGIAVRYTF